MKNLIRLGFASFICIAVCLSCSDDDEPTALCQSDMECLTNNTEKSWKLDVFRDIPQSEWNDCMLDLVMTFNANGSWSYTCPVNQTRAGKWWFSDDGSILYTSPVMTPFWHPIADTVAYEIVTITDNSFAFKVPDNLPERFKVTS